MYVSDLCAMVVGLTGKRAGSKLSSTVRCRDHGYASGHTCLPVPDGMTAPTLIGELNKLFADPQRLIVDGVRARLPAWHSGTAAIEPFGSELTQLSAWPHNAWWVGCGVAGSRTVLFVAKRPGLAPDTLPDDVSLVERIVALADWNADPPHEVDWASVEQRLGTALPADYKEFVAAFGQGLFGYDACLSWLAIHVPDADDMSHDIILRAAWLSAYAAHHHDSHRWKKFGLFPAPGGLLQWAVTERGHGFYWLTDGQDPNRWPVLAHNRDELRWHRFDGSAVECVFRLLTDSDSEFSKAAEIDRPWFGRISPLGLRARAGR